METAITVSVIFAMITIGVLLIHLLNGQHNERIAAFHYGDALPGIGRRGRKSHRPAGHAGSPGVPAHPVAPAHREDREGAADDA
ncbi:hypothetical protein [Streptomyces peucetius]|nr:hypothetical protein CGZ69_18660 [Streptomyces peucetius subsp. caesius ATCC 27952]